jgi:hypothetical protein
VLLVSVTVYCSACGYALPSGVRSPCPLCGGEATTTEVRIEETLIVTDDMGGESGPTEVGRSAARRWSESAAEVSRLEQPLPDATSSTAEEWQTRLHHVFVDLWSLREAAILEGVPDTAVDRVIDTDPDLALAHDLGNLAKHGQLTKRTRSGAVPQLQAPRAVFQGSGPPRFAARIVHGPGIRDGVQVARAAANAWEAHLRGWGVLV